MRLSHWLQDEGWLTCVRTAIAGQRVARALVPREVHGIGITGTGVQARLQLEYLRAVTSCRDVHVWEPNAERRLHFLQTTCRCSGSRFMLTSPQKALQSIQI
ncbi:hypothetical protein [Paraburkholderia sp. BL27I4N3]|uniref:hypothetical protein n=1 Tax=Paraburkholderia sp. BL27I4N3 TaxID=1938805 RepID=UPI0038578C43